MSQGVHRPKRPELVKALLLDACAQQLLSGGPLSIGVVADIAGVTKGAVNTTFRHVKTWCTPSTTIWLRSFKRKLQTTVPALRLRGGMPE